MTKANDKEPSRGGRSDRIEIQIDRKVYTLQLPPDGKLVMTGDELRRLADPPIDPNRDLFEVVPGGSDEKIEDNKDIPIRNGLRFFSAPARINPGDCRRDRAHACTRTPKA